MNVFARSLVFWFVIQSFNVANAAIPRKMETTNPLAFEILTMPEENRNMVAQQRAKELYPQLLKIVKASDQSMQMRWKAMTLLAFIGKEKAVPDLEAWLKAPEWFMRNAALISLHLYHPKRAPAAAQLLLKDKALVVRSAAVEVLKSQLDSKSRDLLWEEFSANYNFRKKQSLWIRGQILSVLADKPESKENELFRKALLDKDSSVHSSAIVALEKITQQKLGTPNLRLAEKRELWIKWAKAHPETTVN